MQSSLKICSKCKIAKEPNEFRKRKELKDGLSSWCKTCHKSHRDSNKEKEKINNKVWYENNKEHAKKLSRKYKQENKETISQKCKERYNADIEYRLRQNIRSRLRTYINKNVSNTVDKNLGCSIEELKKHLESQFTEGMSWDNHGEWHIDHIKPLSKFNLTNKDELKEACNYANLQPLWAKDNLSKGNK